MGDVLPEWVPVEGADIGDEGRESVDRATLAWKRAIESGDPALIRIAILRTSSAVMTMYVHQMIKGRNGK